MVDLLLGFILGLILVGSSTQRQIECHNGNIVKSMLLCTLHNAAYFFSIYFIVEKNIIGFTGTSLGAILVTGYIAYLNKGKKL